MTQIWVEMSICKLHKDLHLMTLKLSHLICQNSNLLIERLTQSSKKKMTIWRDSCVSERMNWFFLRSQMAALQMRKRRMEILKIKRRGKLKVSRQLTSLLKMLKARWVRSDMLLEEWIRGCPITWDLWARSLLQIIMKTLKHSVCQKKQVLNHNL